MSHARNQQRQAARIADLERERENSLEHIGYLVGEGQKLEAENAELRAAFEKYGDHTAGCKYIVYPNARCDCGYDKARAALGGAK